MITKDRTRIYQIYKDEAKQHQPLPPVFLPDFVFAFDQDEPLNGVFVDRITSNLPNELDVYSNDLTLIMDADYSFTTITHNGVSYEFKVFGFTNVIELVPPPPDLPEEIL